MKIFTPKFHRMWNYIALTLLLCSPGFLQAQFTHELPVPPTYSGPDFHINMVDRMHDFGIGTSVATYAYSLGPLGSPDIDMTYLGPTLIMRKDQYVTMHVTNDIDLATTLHWHGMHVSPGNDGGPATLIAPGETWEPKWPVLDHASTMWYHPHPHGETNHQVSWGAAGMIIIRDDATDTLGLPMTYGVDEFPLVLQDKLFDKVITYDSLTPLITPADTCYYGPDTIIVPADTDFVAIDTVYEGITNSGGLGEMMLVNGMNKPYLDVPPQPVRFRMLNGSTDRFYYIGLDDNSDFMQIGTDGGLLHEPNATSRIMVGPGERVEIVVDFSTFGGSTVSLMSYFMEMAPGTAGCNNGGPPEPVGAPLVTPCDQPLKIMEFHIDPVDTLPHASVPVTMVEPWVIPAEADADVVRSKIFQNGLNAGEFLINGWQFDHHRIDDFVRLGDTEIWELYNNSTSTHPFHIHDVQFFVISRENSPPGITLGPSEAGQKDVVNVYPEETVRFIAEFLDFATPDTTYMFHCHMLQHEDLGMMGQFVVIDPNPTHLPDGFTGMGDLLLYPNPSSGRVKISGLDRIQAKGNLRVIDGLGRVIYTEELALLRNAYDPEIDLSRFPNGIYHVMVGEGKEMLRGKLVKQ